MPKRFWKKYLEINGAAAPFDSFFFIQSKTQALNVEEKWAKKLRFYEFLFYGPEM